MHELVHVKFEGVMVETLINIDPDQYLKYARTERGKIVVYYGLSKVMYGTLQYSLLFWRKLARELKALGSDINPYDWYVANKIIDGKQCTIICHMDNLNISHVKDAALDRGIANINKVFVQEDPLTIRQGAMHDSLGMTLDYSNPGNIVITMFNYIQGILEKVVEMFKTRKMIPSDNHLFKTQGGAQPLCR